MYKTVIECTRVYKSLPECTTLVYQIVGWRQVTKKRWEKNCYIVTKFWGGLDQVEKFFGEAEMDDRKKGGGVEMNFGIFLGRCTIMFHKI